MSIYQLILAFIIGIFVNFAHRAFGVAAIVTRKFDKNFWLGMTLIGAVGYTSAQLSLSYELPDTTLLMLHRVKLFFLLITVSSWVFTVFKVYFPDSNYPKVFLLLSFITALLIPLESFLNFPIKKLVISAANIDFTYHLGTPGMAYILMVILILLLFSLVPAVKFFLSSELSQRDRVIGILAFSPGIVGSLNDFAVSNSLVDNIMISEYAFFLFLGTISVHLFQEDANTASRLAHINEELAQRIDLQTKELNATIERLQAMAATDMLTGLCNRRRFTQILYLEESRLRRYQEQGNRTFSLLFLDLDNFKYYNDTFGHAAGDLVLTRFAAILTGILRVLDTAARHGGDEFTILLPNTDEQGALVLANRILKKLEDSAGFTAELSELLGKTITIPENKRIATSIGLLTYEPKELSGCEAILNAADSALYAAKGAGKRCVKTWRELKQNSPESR